jgi:hypothetical protein
MDMISALLARFKRMSNRSAGNALVSPSSPNSRHDIFARQNYG